MSLGMQDLLLVPKTTAAAAVWAAPDHQRGSKQRSHTETFPLAGAGCAWSFRVKEPQTCTHLSQGSVWGASVSGSSAAQVPEQQAGPSCTSLRGGCGVCASQAGRSCVFCYLASGSAPSPSQEPDSTRSLERWRLRDQDMVSLPYSLLLSARGDCPGSGDLSPCPYRPDSCNFPPRSFALFECFQPDSKLMLVPRCRALSYWGITLQLVASGGSLPLLVIFRYQSDVPLCFTCPLASSAPVEIQTCIILISG